MSSRVTEFMMLLNLFNCNKRLDGYGNYIVLEQMSSPWWSGVEAPLVAAARTVRPVCRLSVCSVLYELLTFFRTFCVRSLPFCTFALEPCGDPLVHTTSPMPSRRPPPLPSLHCAPYVLANEFSVAYVYGASRSAMPVGPLIATTAICLI